MDNALGIFAPATERRMIMTCEQCKYITVCMAQADGLGQVFDPNYDGEHGCTDFAPFTNADRIRSMTDEELAAFLCKEKICTFCFCDDFCAIDGVEGNGLLKWLQQPAEKPKEDT